MHPLTFPRWAEILQCSLLRCQACTHRRTGRFQVHSLSMAVTDSSVCDVACTTLKYEVCRGLPNHPALWWTISVVSRAQNSEPELLPRSKQESSSVPLLGPAAPWSPVTRYSYLGRGVESRNRFAASSYKWSWGGTWYQEVAWLLHSVCRVGWGGVEGVCARWEYVKDSSGHQKSCFSDLCFLFVVWVDILR